jgi:glycosyltransferase involved in cell wall biosynthesis
MPCTADLVRRAEPRRDLRRELELEDAVVVGWVGSFRRFHHADMIVRAVAEVQRIGAVALLMVGDGATRENCVAQAEELGVRHAVFTGAVPHDQIVDHLAAMDVAVIPSAPDGDFHYSPLKLKEYLAAGKAVVAPAAGEMGRLLRDGEDVLLYAPGDVQGMVLAIERLVEDEQLRRALGERGRETYDRLFTMDRQLELIAGALGLP